MINESDVWPMKVENEAVFKTAEIGIIMSWMCRVSLRKFITSVRLRGQI